MRETGDDVPDLVGVTPDVSAELILGENQAGGGGEAARNLVSSLAMRLIDPNTKIVLMTNNIPYGSKLFFNSGDLVKKGDVIIEWDPFNAVIVSEVSGKIEFESVIENVTYKVYAQRYGETEGSPEVFSDVTEAIKYHYKCCKAHGAYAYVIQVDYGAKV